MRILVKKIYFISCIFLFMPACDQDRSSDGSSDRSSGGLPDELLKCMNEGAKWCYRELTNKSGCFVLVETYSIGNSFTWSGACKNGLAQGKGRGAWKMAKKGGLNSLFESAKITVNGKDVAMGGESGVRLMQIIKSYEEGSYRGSYIDGKRAGMWTFMPEKGDGFGGPYVDGKKNGRWIDRHRRGEVHKGPYVNGERNGHWVIRDRRGEVHEGPYVNGKKNGRWRIENQDGSKSCVDFKSGWQDSYPEKC